MKALTLWEPWASAMKLGLKRNETRGWQTYYRGDLLICSAKRQMSREEKVDPEAKGMRDIWDRVNPTHFGYALCVVTLHCCRMVKPDGFVSDSLPVPNEPISDEERSMGWYEFGRFAWITDNLRVLKEPLPVKGAQGLWNVKEPLLSQVLAQL